MKKIIAALGLMGLLSCQGKTDGTTVTLRPLEAKFIYLEGEVEVLGAPAELDMLVPEGAVIKTDADSYAEIRISTGNIVSLGPSTSLVWNLHFGTPELNLEEGNLSAILTSLAPTDGEERLRLVTPTTVAGVRGTSFFTQVEMGGENTYFCLCNGQISLESGAGWTDIEAAEHAAFTFIQRDGIVVQEAAPLLYHDNASMNALAAKIGVEIDWTEAHSY